MGVKEIRGVFVHDDGTEAQWNITAQDGWNQWGNNTERLGSTVDLIEAISEAVYEHLGGQDAS